MTSNILPTFPLSSEGRASQRSALAARLHRMAWIPIPTFLAAVVFLSWIDLQISYESDLLLPALNIVFSTGVSLLVAYLAAASYLSGGPRSVLALGCGVMAFGLVSLIAGFTMRMNPNAAVTAYNLGVCFAGLCHLYSALSASSASPPVRIRPVAACLTGAYGGVLLIIALIVLFAWDNRAPAFFVPGEGATTLRQAVLGTAVALFALAAVLFQFRHRRHTSDFMDWYSLALGLIAVGLWGMFHVTSLGSPLAWIGRGSQYVGGIYMLVALWSLVGDFRAKGIPLSRGLAIFFQQAAMEYRPMVEAAGDPILSLDPSGRVLFWNPAAERRFGQPLAQAYGVPLADLVALPGGQEALRQQLAALPRSDDGLVAGTSFEADLKAVDGVFPAELTFLGSRTGQGSLTICIVKDISQRRAAEQALRRAHDDLERLVAERTAQLAASEQRLAQAVEAADAGIWHLDLETGEFVASDRALAILAINGLKPGARLDLAAALEPVHPEDRDRVAAEATRAIRERTGYHVEFRCVRPDGSVRWLASQARVADGPAGRRLAGLVQDITERREAAEAQIQSNEKLRLAATAADLGTWEHDLLTDRLTWDAKYCEIFGIPSDVERSFEKFIEAVHPEDRDRIVEASKRTMDEGVDYAEDYRIALPDGQTRWIHGRGSLQRGTDGKPVRVAGVVMDVTRRKRTNEKLRQSEQRYHTLFEAMTEGFALHEIITDEHGRPSDFRFLDANPAFERLTGLKRADLIGKRVLEVLPDTEPHWIEGYGRVALSGEPLHLESYSSELGRWYEAYAYCTAPGQFAVVFADVTERRRAGENLRESEERFRTMADGLPLIVWVHDAQGQQQFVNRTYCEFFGITPEEAEGGSWQVLMHPEDSRAYTEEFLACVCQRRAFHGEARVRSADGQWRWIESWGRPRFSPSGEYLGVVGTSADFTDRKRAEALLKLHADRLSRLVHASTRVLACSTLESLLQTVAESARELLQARLAAAGHGYRDGTFQVGGASRAEGLPPCPPGEIFRLEKGGVYLPLLTGERTVRLTNRQMRAHPDWWGLPAGHAPLNGLVGAGLLGADGRPSGLLMVSDKEDGADFDEQDETLLTELAAVTSLAMQHLEARMSAETANVAKSQFLANMSHELRTPMNAILGMTDLALREELAPAIRDYLQTAKDSADVLLELLNQLLDFSRIEAGQMELEQCPFELRRTVTQVVKALGVRASEKHLELACDVADDVPDAVVGDPLRLRQVLVNLVGNAIKFTTEGEIVVAVAVDSHGEGEAVLDFAVSDTGVGIAPEEQERIFSPFTQADASTTRRHGGSGLGLAIVKSLVGLMGGAVRLESEPGRGSTFSFTARLGLAEEPKAAAAAGPPAREALCGVPALVVATSAGSRRVLQRTLASWGLEPETAADAAGALAKAHEAAAAGKTFRLLVTDAALPETDGFALAERLTGSPLLAGPAILMLPAADRSSQAERCRQLGAACVEKPVSQSDLFDVIAGALGVEHRRRGRPDDVPVKQAARPLRVLLAEDTPANQKLVVYLLTGRGHAVEVASNGQEALDRLQQDDFDAVLMDVQMPVMDGLKATAAIRGLSEPSKARVPVIAMTAHALRGDAERCLAAGMDAYISKPIDGEKLIELVERAADGKSETEPEGESRKEREGRSAPSVPTSAPPGAFDLDQAVRQCFGKYEMFQEMVGCLFDEADPLLAQILVAIERQDADAVYQSAHRLKNTVAYLAAAGARAATEQVESLGRSGDLTETPAAVERLATEVNALKTAIAEHRP